MSTSSRPQDVAVFVCPRTGKVIRPRPVSRWKMWLFPISGLLCLAWFLVRVLPKPSRALYPCQRMAFPVASGFIAWLVGMATMIVAFRKAKEFGKQRRALIAVACLAVAAGAGLHTLFNVPVSSVEATPPDSHGPLGVARGTNPGRVVLVHDKRATPYTGTGWWWQHTDQAVVDRMMSVALRRMTGTSSDQVAWDAIFRYYNSTHGRGNVGYTSGEKIMIKVNLVGSITGVNTSTYEQISEQNVVVVAPQMELALLRQLVNKANVPQDCISIGDTICYFAKHHWDVVFPEFRYVKYLDKLGNLGRTRALSSNQRVYWSSASGTGTYYAPQAAVDATYHINFANLKIHEGGGVSLCGKNHYGSMCQTPNDFMHNSLPYITSGMGRYRTLVDLLGHAQFGGKCILYLHDGLYTCTDARKPPIRWNSAPFNGNWPSVLLASQDPMAIDSVGFDLCYMEFPTGFPGQKYGADDYLHEGAMAPNPPSGITYDPERDGVELTSLGTHEHWNNSTDKKYSRNLGTGNGIELMWLETAKAGDVNFDNYVNVGDLQALVAAWGSSAGQPSHNPDADLNSDSYVNVGDLQVLVQNWGS